AQYQGCLFLHQGWPLCLGEQLVLQLSALDWRALQPEDFYLQLAPTGSRGARLVLKCRAWGGENDDDDPVQELEEAEEAGGMVEVPIAEDSYPHLFTVEWLDGVNRRLRLDARSPPRRLRSCLLASAGGRLRRMRWSRLVCPRLREPPAAPAGRPRASGDGAAADDPLRLREAAACTSGATDKGGGGGWDPAHQRQQEDVEAGEYVELREVSTPGAAADDAVAGKPRLRSSTLPAAGGGVRPGRRRRGAQAQHRAWVHQPRRRRRKGAACGEAAAHVAAGRPHAPSPRETEPANGPPHWRGLVSPTRWAEGGPGDGAPLDGRSGSVAAWTRLPLAERSVGSEPPAAEGQASIIGNPLAERETSTGSEPPLAERDEPTTAKPPLAERDEPTTAKAPLAERDEPTTAKVPLAERKEPTTAKAPLAEQKEPTTAKPPSAERKEPTTAKPPLAERKESTTAKAPLAKQKEPTTTHPPLAELKESTTAKPPLAERKDPTRDVPPSTAQEGSTAAELPLAEQDESAGGQLFLTQLVSRTGWPLVEQNGSVIGPGLPLAKQQGSKTGAARSPAEVEESAGSEMPLAGQSRSTLGLERPLAVRDRSITQTDQPLAQQRKSTVSEPTLAGQGKLIIRSGLLFGEQDRSMKGTKQSQAEQNQSPDEQPPPITVTELSLVEPERVKAKLTECSLIERSGSQWKREPFSAGVGTSSDRDPQSVLETESRRSPADRRAVSLRGIQTEEGHEPASSERSQGGAPLPVEPWRAVGEVERSPGVLGQADTGPSDLQVRCQRSLGASHAAEEATSDTLDARPAQWGSLGRKAVSGDGTAPARSAPISVPPGERDGQRILNEVGEVGEEVGEMGPPPNGDIWQGDNKRGLTQEGSDETCQAGDVSKHHEVLEDSLPRSSRPESQSLLSLSPSLSLSRF
ncbi:rho guanine nucleotide exchange factor 40-like, partial [Chiloscyllium plagiosum]|uniref:rho guanine nucleotide exchange factor 40-like n=1 Tax=Chiloscyllium plagiosum TaxID=36176 RepID=UPI001CB86E4E